MRKQRWKAIMIAQGYPKEQINMKKKERKELTSLKQDEVNNLNKQWGFLSK
ncbi:hypothetical protein PDR89_22915 [Bacillus cereus group sp. Bc002]|uniref:hypothetical protein n=1 Tax=Bacillus cereus group TaxID=86661 RepID=UPI0022E29780|nr:MULTISPECIES: hypothetical protein [Bacillus cereus group]MDA2782281.1 hypothetical protein [Bacillus cereus group sp. Bc002]MED1647988.1 hypothetical protein [Bacillus pacificus]